MRLILKLGLKNLGRNRARTIFTIAAVVLCSAGITLYSVVFSGAVEMMLRGMVSQTGHIRLLHPKLAENEKMAAGRFFVDRVTQRIQALKKDPNIRSVAPRIMLGAFIDHNGRQAPAMGLGVLPEAEKDQWELHKKIAAGRLFRNNKKEVMLGHRLAARLHLKVGDSITMIGKTVDESMSALRLRVVGFLKMGNAVQDKMFLLPLPAAQYFLDIPNQATSILLFTKDMWKTRTLVNTLKSKPVAQKVTVQPWQESPMAATMLPLVNVMLYILGGIIAFIGSIGLLNTLTMSVMERRREIGLMMALGLRPRRIAGLFLTEGLLIGVIGGVIGVSIAALASIPLITKGLTFGGEATSKLPIPIETSFRGVLNLQGILMGLAVGILATLIGTLWPAIKAARMNPIEALHKPPV